jgi:hypothetical protein
MTGQPLRSPATLAALLLLTLLTPTALPDVTLISQQARSGFGSFSSGPEGSTSVPTTYTVNNNFTDVSPDGLHVKITRTGSGSAGRGPPVQLTSLASWTIQDFEVVFRVDEPTPFTAKSEGSWGRPLDTNPRHATLVLQGGTTIFPSNPGYIFSYNQSGILEPGTYTFSGSVGNVLTLSDVPAPNTPALTLSGSINAELTVGVPEPAALPAIFAALLLTRRQR